MARTISLYDAATSRGRLIRQGEIVQLVMDGAGAFVCSAQDFMTAQKWAQAKTASTNLITDRGRFIEKIEILIARPNSFVATRGSQEPLTRLAKAMKMSGYDMGEWMLPPEVKEALKPKLPVFKSQEEKDAEKAAALAAAATAPAAQPAKD